MIATMAELSWFKSSYSGPDGGDCVEVALDWHKSSYSGSDGGDCVEVAQAPTAVHIRDSKDTARACLTASPTAWTAFLGQAAAHN